MFKWRRIGKRSAHELDRLLKESGSKRVHWVLDYIENIQGGYASRNSGSPLDKAEDPLPWYTYPCIEYLNQLDFSSCAIFEYGCGNSSLYWAERARQIVSVESDRNWFERINNQRRSNQTLILAEEVEQYVHAPDARADEFDIYVIDGAFRYDCVAHVLTLLKPASLVIFDNTDWYPSASSLLRDAGLKQLDFIGMGPLNNYAWCTSLYFRGEWMLPRQAGHMGLRVKGGLVQVSADDQSVIR